MKFVLSLLWTPHGPYCANLYSLRSTTTSGLPSILDLYPAKEKNSRYTVLSSISCIGRCRGHPLSYRQWELRYRFGIPSEKRKKYNNLNNLKSTTIARETTYLALRNIISVMLESTIRRYKIIRKEVYKRLGKMSTMMAYADVAQEMGLTEETVRKIIRKINKWDMVPTKK